MTGYAALLTTTDNATPIPHPLPHHGLCLDRSQPLPPSPNLIRRNTINLFHLLVTPGHHRRGNRLHRGQHVLRVAFGQKALAFAAGEAPFILKTQAHQQRQGIAVQVDALVDPAPDGIVFLQAVTL